MDNTVKTDIYDWIGSEDIREYLRASHVLSVYEKALIISGAYRSIEDKRKALREILEESKNERDRTLVLELLRLYDWAFETLYNDEPGQIFTFREAHNCEIGTGDELHGGIDSMFRTFEELKEGMRKYKDICFTYGNYENCNIRREGEIEKWIPINGKMESVIGFELFYIEGKICFRRFNPWLLMLHSRSEEFIKQIGVSDDTLNIHNTNEVNPLPFPFKTGDLVKLDPPEWDKPLYGVIGVFDPSDRYIFMAYISGTQFETLELRYWDIGYDSGFTVIDWLHFAHPSELPKGQKLLSEISGYISYLNEKYESYAEKIFFDLFDLFPRDIFHEPEIFTLEELLGEKYCDKHYFTWKRNSRRHTMNNKFICEDNFVFNIDIGGIEAYIGADSDIVIPKTIDGREVRIICENAFRNCTALTSVTIPNSVTEIGSGAFCNCPRLSSAVLSEGLKAIGSDAFWGCESLISIIIPNSVERIDENIFWGCKKLMEIVLPDGLTAVSAGTFRGCESLEKIDIPSGVTRIEDDAFGGCTKLIGINIPDSVTEIQCFAFSNCKSLANIVIPNGVSQIEDLTFSCCTNLTDINIPDSVIKIGDNAFEDCIGLTAINIPDSVQMIGIEAFSGCKNLISVNIPNGVARIKSGTFSGCSNLTNVVLPNSITKISRRAFENCTALTSINIPAGVTKLGEGLFSGCTGLTGITIPDSVTEIHKGAFIGCTNITHVSYKGITYGRDNMSGLYKAINGEEGLPCKVLDKVTDIEELL